MKRFDVLRKALKSMMSTGVDSHTFCKLADIASKSCGSEVWTFGYLKETNLSEGYIHLSYESVNVDVNISMLEIATYQKGGLYTCLAYVEKNCVLLAKILKLSNGFDTDLFVKVVTY